MSLNRKKFEELELKDDFMFGKVMSSKALCKETLETLLGIEIEDIHSSDAQKTLNITYQRKVVRLDYNIQNMQYTVYD